MDNKYYECQFCYSTVSMVECHGHYHCTKCNMPNFSCCDGEMEYKKETDEIFDNCVAPI